MPENKRKYEIDMSMVQDLQLEPVSSENPKPKHRKSSHKRYKKRGFSQEVIFGIIEKIKDM
jgi:hypothetical protein